jgi:hypothetical protein
MDRRAFVSSITFALLAVPLVGEAQQTFSGSCQAIWF